MYIHKQDLAHRDLKPENIMIDQDFKIKLIDLGFVAPLQGRDGSGNLKTKLGTKPLMAPEISISNKGYKGDEVDLFALGVILFTLKSGHYPF